MDVFREYLEGISDSQQRIRTEEVLNWIKVTYPQLSPKIAWNQPMFTDHGTFIIGFSISKQHLAVAPERAGIIHFSDEIVKAGYEHTTELIRLRWNRPIDYALLDKIITFNIAEKASCSTFWRK